MGEKIDPELKAKIEADMEELDGKKKPAAASAPKGHFVDCTECNSTGLVPGPLQFELCPACDGSGKKLADKEPEATV